MRIVIDFLIDYEWLLRGGHWTDGWHGGGEVFCVSACRIRLPGEALIDFTFLTILIEINQVLIRSEEGYTHFGY